MVMKLGVRQIMSQGQPQRLTCGLFAVLGLGLGLGCVCILCVPLCVQVLQYNPSLQVVAQRNPPSDPYMVLVPSKRKYSADIVFHTSSVNVGGTVTEARNYATIVARNAAKDTLQLDNRLVS